MIDTFEGAVVVVTGGSSGIGRSLAFEMSSRGAKVAIADVNEERLEEARATLEGRGATVYAARCDVTNTDEVNSLRDGVLDRFGSVDLLCNNAGVFALGPPEHMDLTDWAWIMNVNVLGIVRCVQAFVPSMLDRGTGHVLNTASSGGTWAYTWDAAAYITSKFAAYGLSEALYRRLRPCGIGVSVLCPGLVQTNLMETARVSGVPESQRNEWFFYPPEMLDPVDVEAVGTIAADGVRAGQFAIFTHPSDAARFRSWRADIEESLNAAVASSPTPPTLLPNAE